MADAAQTIRALIAQNIRDLIFGPAFDCQFCHGMGVLDRDTSACPDDDDDWLEYCDWCSARERLTAIEAYKLGRFDERGGALSLADGA